MMNMIFEYSSNFIGNVKWYAVCILIGLLIAVWAGLREGRRLGIYQDFIYYGVLFTVPIAIVGARLWYVLFNLSEFHSLSDVLGITTGGLSGLAIQGGAIAAFGFIVFYCKHHKVSFRKTVDIMAPGFFIGQICGRWGNFFNQELYGPAVSNVKVFKALLPSFITDNMLIEGLYRHPAFLYESLLNLIGLIIILVLRRKCKKLESGDLLSFYMVWYGMVRCITETIRSHSGVDEVLMLGPIQVSVLISILFIIGGVAFFVIKRLLHYNEKYQDILDEVKNSHYDTILFDFDGTLMNTKPLIDSSMIYTFNHFKPDLEITDEMLDSFFGPPLKDTFLRFESDPKKVEEMMNYYRGYNLAHHDELAKPFPRCKEIVKKLYNRGYNIGIVSSKKRDILEQGIKLCGIENYIDVVISYEDIKNPKPAPDGINQALDKLNNPGKVLYVGDHPSDILAGKNAHIMTCGVGYMNGKYEEVLEQEPDYVIYGLYELIVILNE